MTTGSFLGACALDLAFGDPRRLPHPVRAIGRIIQWGQQRIVPAYAARPRAALAVGIAVATGFPAAGYLVVWSAIRAAELIEAGPLLETLFGYWALAARDLADHARRVAAAVAQKQMEEAREAVGQIVGRDTDGLPESEVVRATVETVAESGCDGIVAPILFLAIGGAPLAWAYKTVNTLDSMIGHREPPYRDIGWASARLDDVANWIPARLTACLIVVAGGIRFVDWRRWRDGWCTLMRDGAKHPSPNSGRPEAAMAGVLGIQLGGLNRYDGRPDWRPVMGRARAPMTADRITEAVTLIWMVAAINAALAAWILW
jgi:adenosylcobinamide-phosphate synthase